MDREKGSDGQSTHLVQSTLTSQLRNYTSVMPGVRRLRQEDHTLKASLLYIARLCVKIKSRTGKWPMAEQSPIMTEALGSISGEGGGGERRRDEEEEEQQ